MALNEEERAIMVQREFEKALTFYEQARFYSQLQTLREKADYNCIWEATERDVLPMMPLAQAFMEKIKQRLEPYI